MADKKDRGDQKRRNLIDRFGGPVGVEYNNLMRQRNELVRLQSGSPRPGLCGQDFSGVALRI